MGFFAWLAQYQVNGWTDFHQILATEPSRVKDELIRFWPYLVNFRGNGGAKYGKIWTFGAVMGERMDGFPPKFS